jgi:hypothetical protein
MATCNDSIYKAVQAAMLKKKRTTREDYLIAKHKDCCVRKVWQSRIKHNNQLHISGIPVMNIGDK